MVCALSSQSNTDSLASLSFPHTHTLLKACGFHESVQEILYWQMSSLQSFSDYSTCCKSTNAVQSWTTDTDEAKQTT